MNTRIRILTDNRTQCQSFGRSATLPAMTEADNAGHQRLAQRLKAPVVRSSRRPQRYPVLGPIAPDRERLPPADEPVVETRSDRASRGHGHVHPVPVGDLVGGGLGLDAPGRAIEQQRRSLLSEELHCQGDATAATSFFLLSAARIANRSLLSRPTASVLSKATRQEPACEFKTGSPIRMASTRRRTASLPQPVPREGNRSASQDPDTLQAKSVSRCTARRDRPCHLSGWPAGHSPDDRSSRALAPRRPCATAGSTGWPGACPLCGRRETAGRDMRQAWEGTRGRV